MPLTLAGAAVAAGFLSFLPTDYRGVSEFGQIAGVGMLIAYATSITLLPALIALFNPPGEPEPIGYRALAPIDRFLQNYRYPVIIGTAGIAVLGLPLLYSLTFDFDPIHLRSPKTESISTLLDLGGDPQVGINSINVVMPSLDQAASAGRAIAKAATGPSHDHTVRLHPGRSGQKLGLIKDFAGPIGANPAKARIGHAA